MRSPLGIQNLAWWIPTHQSDNQKLGLEITEHNVHTIFTKIYDDPAYTSF